MIDLDLILRDYQNFRRRLEEIRRQEKKALDVAMRVEGFRLKKEMAAEIRQGAPGGRPWPELSKIQKLYRHRNRNQSPLRRLAIGVRYYIRERDPLEISVGFEHPRVKGWKRIARRHERGFRLSADTPLKGGPTPRQRFRQAAIEKVRGLRSARSRTTALRSLARQKYPWMFLRRRTRTLDVPARPIIDPFWRKHETEAWRNIRNNFIRKRRGERI